MRAVWLITAKDLKLHLRNRTVLILGFLVPLSLAFVLNLVFGGFDDPDGPVRFDVGVVDADGGEVARGFTAVVDEVAATGVLDVTTYDDEAAARAAVDDGDISAAWVVPAGFSTAVTAGDAAELTVIGDVDSPTTTSVARAIAEGYATGVGTATLAATVAVETGAVAPEEAAAVAAEVAARPSLVGLAPVEAGSQRLDPTTSLIAGLALFFVFFTAGLPLLSILEERSNGTLSRLLVAPIRPAAIMTGKAAASILLGVTSLASLMLASAVIMGAEWGPPAGALLLALAAVVAASGIMAVAGSLARTTEQAGSTQAIVAVVFGILGGSFVPLAGSESGVLARLQQLTPNGQFVDGLGALAHGGMGAALPAVGTLVAMGVVTGAVGLRLSRSVLRR